ncbi:MAG: pyrroline-5-carboxylate reductase [Chitinophagaceae bacterium]|nr:pyrroline-5-carboxylate reductase [Chitinophagaceae bacterium]MDP1763993.1 pyrroline-5-carboxylate reductase [Sediminibacterium sp.]MDP1809892.1 pyrroline-5-carboxylate reductase [Sediminibacterium sp.]MDP3665938.1 pyrroline-5-carboxylate reductase [Sediminibacterium sp.]
MDHTHGSANIITGKSKIMSKKLAIIGGGNLGASMAEGLVSSGFILPEHLTVTKRNISSLSELSEKGVLVTSDNEIAVKEADWIVLAVKPFQLKEVLSAIQPCLDPSKHILISVVTGIWIKDIQEVVGNRFAIFRAMPNTAIAIRESMTCVCSHQATEAQLAYVTDLFNQLGRSVFIEEKLMDAATVLGACGTAYAMRYIRANIQGGIEIGFNVATASLIAAQTVKGAAELLLQKNTHPEQEIDKVTTPKGCTIAGLNEMEHQGFSSSLIKGIITSYKKIVDDM